VVRDHNWVHADHLVVVMEDGQHLGFGYVGWEGGDGEGVGAGVEDWRESVVVQLERPDDRAIT
jgi:hypothetical protein